MIYNMFNKYVFNVNNFVIGIKIEFDTFSIESD